MSIKIIDGELPWSDKKKWFYPSADIGTLLWWFWWRDGPLDVDLVVSKSGPLLAKKRTCLQAGGCIGVWPIRLAQIFDRVITFEPEPVNHECLVKNTEGIENIEIHQAALGSNNTLRVHMGLHPQYVGHCGAFEVMLGGNIPVVCVDDLGLDDLDLMWLDLEGYEKFAIMGAEKTIDRCRPVIGIEHKKKQSDETSGGGKALSYLVSKLNYRIHSKIRTDTMLVPR